MNWKYFAAALVYLLLMWRIDSLGDDLELEKKAHESTRAELHQAQEDGLGWKAAYEKARDAAQAHKDTAAACMERELQARQDRQEREAILQPARPRPRTEQEQRQVIDDETRKRAADRLNRPL